MKTDAEIWDQVTREAEQSLGEYPDPDIGRCFMTAFAVLICAVSILSFTSDDNDVLQATLIGALVGASQYASRTFRRWAYRHRLRTEFWSVRSEHAAPDEVDDRAG